MTLACATWGYCLHVKARGAPLDGEVLGVRSGVCPPIVPLNGAGNGGQNRGVQMSASGGWATKRRHNAINLNAALVKPEGGKRAEEEEE